MSFVQPNLQKADNMIRGGCCNLPRGPEKSPIQPYVFFFDFPAHGCDVSEKILGKSLALFRARDNSMHTFECLHWIVVCVCERFWNMYRIRRGILSLWMLFFGDFFSHSAFVAWKITRSSQDCEFSFVPECVYYISSFLNKPSSSYILCFRCGICNIDNRSLRWIFE